MKDFDYIMEQLDDVGIGISDMAASCMCFELSFGF